jgi:PAS domain-containing protein
MASAAGRPSGDGPAQLGLMHDLLLRLPAGVAYVAGPGLAFEFANEEFRKIADGRDLIGVPLREALPERARDHLDLIENVAKTGESCRGRESEVWIGGHGQEPEQLFVDFIYQPVRGEAGDVSGVLLYGADVTAHVRDRRRLEVLAERLAVTEERYRTLFETLPHGVIHYNADGSILGANPAAADILGLDPDAITSWPLVRPPACRPPGRRAVQAGRGSGDGRPAHR